MKNLTAPVAISFLRLSQVIARTGLSRSEIYRRVQSGTFPAPVKLGTRASAWASHELSQWAEARLLERDAGVSA